MKQRLDAIASKASRLGIAVLPEPRCQLILRIGVTSICPHEKIAGVKQIRLHSYTVCGHSIFDGLR